ncbi:TNF receptor-associated factor family protein DDB_G0272098 isoform X2 [Musca domestica]|uniref:TNF receptor-associated factor family protein DDB_G0272098 isoform X2 n=1 Tax=Musca domestica TaxID=7370 RepID=A0A1I8N557_MUSDO|nr:TNF receptor-associated factor family protein DDB_G0272098 isoform X2 [Musca domestica]
MASRNSRTSGMRLLWIPGGRKGHPKGRFDSTNKKISYSTRQKKSEVWSLGGSKAQNELLTAEPDVSLLDGPSTSGIASIACATAVGSSAAVIAKNSNNSTTFPSNEAAAAECLTNASDSHQQQQQHNQTSPTTPNSTASTAQLISPPLSPLIQTDLDQIDSDTESFTMPAKSHQPIPVIVTTTTTAQIMDENRYSILGKDITTNEFDIYTLPSPPKDAIHTSIDNLNSSSGTTASQISPSESPIHKESIITTAITNESHTNHHSQPQLQQQQQEQNGSVNSTPVKKKHHNRNHNNNQGDVNSIESITEDTTSEKIPSGDLDWVDSALQARNDREILTKSKTKKKKNKLSKGKGLDQLDGVPSANKEENKNETPEDDEKVVKCLYYTLMCCDCSLQ